MDNIKSQNANILVVDDILDNLRFLSKTLTEQGYKVRCVQNGARALKAAQLEPPDLVLLDIKMPQMDGYEVCQQLKASQQTQEIPIIFLSALDDITNKVKAFEVGGVDYITKPFQHEEVLARVHIHLSLRDQQIQLEKQNAELIKLNEQLKQEIARREQAENTLQVADAKLFSMLSEQEAKRWGISGFIGKSQSIIKVLDEIRRLQDVEKTNVLILGESGTGKELIARALHFGGVRAKGPFMPVNCSAIPDELAESHFFGHMRGAFTGATRDRKGYFELANGGTLFLDEIGDMPKRLQAKLLRTLEDGTLMPVGGHQEKKVNVRIIAATNANLSAKIATSEFREDLYFRLAGYIIDMPPLRERKEDIPLLAKHMLSAFAEEMGRPQATLTPEALATLENYHFPGNIRELKNLIEHALISSGGAQIQPQHFHFIESPPVISVQPNPAVETISSPSATNVEPAVFQIGPPDQAVSDEEKILVYVREHGRINNTQCRQLLELDRDRCSRLLTKMNKEGKLLREGERRGVYYRLATNVKESKL
jgi:DNA-binding NtrC family response regulator